MPRHVFLLCSILLTSMSLSAQTETKIAASDADDVDSFGVAVSLFGATAIVGATGNDDAGSNSGSAYVYYRDRGGIDNWGEVTKLTASDAASGERFGQSVSVSGDAAIIGANGGNSAYIVGRHHGGMDNWGEVAKLEASDGMATDQFGRAVGLSGDTAIVGAQVADSSTGAAYIFDRDEGGTDAWGEVIKLVPAGTDESFGRSVAIDGDTAVVGATGSNAVYVFERDQGGVGNWGQVARVTVPDMGRFGDSVSISGDTIVAGATDDAENGDESGAAYILERDQGGLDNWGVVKKLLASDGAEDDAFGESVSIDEDRVVVGAIGNFASTGQAYVFARNQGGTNNWGETGKLTPSDGIGGDDFGESVSVFGETALVGADNAFDADFLRTGSAYIHTGNPLPVELESFAID